MTALSAFDTKVCDALVNLVTNKDTTTRFFKTYGDELYKTFRKGLVAKGFVVPRDPDQKVQQKKRSPRDQIIFNNTISKLNEKLTRTTSILDKMHAEQTTCISEYIATNDIVDIRSAGFIYLSWFIHENTVETKVAFGVIVSLQRYIKAVSSVVFSDILTGDDTAAPALLVADLEQYLSRNIKKYGFRGDTLYEVEPNLIVEGPYDKYIPKPIVKPFVHQKLLSDIILSIGRVFEHASVKTPSTEPLKSAYVEVRVLTSAGKTTSIVNVATAVKMRRSVFPDLRIYAVCAIEPIRRRWASLLAYSEIPYFSYDEPHEEDAQPKRNAVVVICSPETSLQHLATNRDSILFYDEPTLYSDGTDALKLLNGVAVLKLMPRFVFLCSATLDIRNRELYNAHLLRFPDSVFIDVFSPEIYGYSNVRTLDGIVVTPHMCCKSQEELESTIQRLETVPLLGKFYNPSVVKQMYDVAKKFSNDIPNVDEIFGDVENLSPDTVRKVAYALLKRIVTFDNRQITEICKLAKTGHVVNFDNLGTTDAHKYQHVNLIATTNPVAFAETRFKKLTDAVKAEIGGSYESLRRPLATWLEQRDDIKRKIKSEEERARALEEHELSRPKCYIPEKFQINTFEHIRKYGNKSTGRCRIPFTEILECGHVSETVDLVTQVGVGVYKQSDLPRVYTNLLMGDKGLVADGRFEFVVADADIAYGIDCPFGGLFIDKSLCEIISLNTLFQLISRVGRGRKSPYANIFIDRLALENIMEMVRDDEYENEETEMLLGAYKRVSCSFSFSKEKRPVVLLNIPFAKNHTKFETKNGETFLYENEKVVWQGTTKFAHDVMFSITNSVLMSAGKAAGVVLV